MKNNSVKTVVVELDGSKCVNILRGSQKEKIETDLTNFAKGFLMSEYGLELKHGVKINNRLSTCLGCVKMIGERKIVGINMSGKLISYALLDTDTQRCFTSVLDVLKHELIHYALITKGLEYHDGSKLFESELARLNVSSSGGTRDKFKKSKANQRFYNMVDIVEIEGNTEIRVKPEKSYDRYRYRNGKKVLKVVKHVIEHVEILA